jgi:Xaa-Pro aminopeptidase
MSKTRFFLIFLSVLILFHGFEAQGQEAKFRMDIQQLIIKEKLATILPKAMRENNIDMWIIVNKYGLADPLTAYLGGGGRPGDKYYQHQFVGYLIFTDRGGDMMERASIGDKLLPKREHLKKFVEERDPERIAVNMSELLGQADGLSYTEYKTLVKDLGERYAERLVSSEYLVSDFMSLKVAAEIAVFAKSIQLTGHLMERALSNEVIKPGVTTLGDIALWVADQMIARGYEPSYGQPRIIYPNMAVDKDGRQMVKHPRGPYSRVIQRGDLVGWDGGIRLWGGYNTDIERYAYVLREGETDLPDVLKDVMRHSVKVRNECRKIVKPGRTALETLKLMWKRMEELGYEIQEIEDNVTDSSNIEVCIGWHGVGERGHGVGPTIWTDKEQKFKSHLVLKPTQLHAFEMFIFYPIPEWGGKKLRFDIEDNVIVTENGVELFIPQIDKINLVR